MTRGIGRGWTKFDRLKHRRRENKGESMLDLFCFLHFLNQKAHGASISSYIYLVEYIYMCVCVCLLCVCKSVYVVYVRAHARACVYVYVIYVGI